MHLSSFALVLEAAAAQAWSRRAFTARARPAIHTTDHGPRQSSEPFDDAQTHRAPFYVAAKSPTPGKAQMSQPVRVRPIRPSTLSMDDFRQQDSGRVAEPVPSDPPAVTGMLVSVPAETLPFPTIPLPTSRASLYRNLVFIMSNPPFSVRTVIGYYFDSPKALHSTRSFNLLISLALRNASFASVGRLFSAMRAESIPENMETWKLYVRWLVRTGRWNDAWRRVLEITREQNVATNFRDKPIPLPLWLELFGSQKRGALRQWVIADSNPDMKASSDADSSLALEGAGCSTTRNATVEDTRDSITHFRKRLMPRPCERPYAVKLPQYRALMQASPLLVSSDKVEIPPQSILIITRTMYQVGQRSLAFSTALSYVKSLPPQLTRCDRRKVLNLVNCHLSMVTWHRKPSLKQHFIQRRILWQFLRARPDLTPSSTTLFLLLSPLRNCRCSGTLAMQCLHIFEKRWGPRIQSGLVRRRVASLALKEGRLDIVVAMMKLERRRSVFDDTLPRTVCTSRRRPWRTMFSRRGAENRRWYSIKKRYQQRLTLGSGSSIA